MCKAMDRDPLMMRLAAILVALLSAIPLVLLAGMYLRVPLERLILLLVVLLAAFLYPWILAFIMVKLKEEERA